MDCPPNPVPARSKTPPRISNVLSMVLAAQVVQVQLSPPRPTNAARPFSGLGRAVSYPVPVTRVEKKSLQPDTWGRGEKWAERGNTDRQSQLQPRLTSPAVPVCQPAVRVGQQRDAQAQQPANAARNHSYQAGGCHGLSKRKRVATS